VFAAPQAAYTRMLIDAIPLPVLDPGWLTRAAEPMARRSSGARKATTGGRRRQFAASSCICRAGDCRL
jgi:hypothetical protein